MIWGEEGWGIYSSGCLAQAERTGRMGRVDVADDACTERTGGRALTKRSGGRADERTSGRGGKATDDRADGGGKGADSGADGRTGGWADKRSSRRADWVVGADERVGLGLKGHIPRGPLHSWAPNPLASSERERAGCLGVQWGPARLHVKHPYLAPGLTCLV